MMHAVIARLVGRMMLAAQVHFKYNQTLQPLTVMLHNVVSAPGKPGHA